MASTVASTTLKVTITESITLKGVNQGGTNVLSISGINETSRRIVSIPTTEKQILAFSTAIANGTFITGDVRYIRVTNLDDTNFVTLTFVESNASAEFKVKLDAMQTFIFNTDNAAGLTGTVVAGDTGLADTLYNLTSISALADTAACDLEVFVACA